MTLNRPYDHLAPARVTTRVGATIDIDGERYIYRPGVFDGELYELVDPSTGDPEFMGWPLHTYDYHHVDVNLDDRQVGAFLRDLDAANKTRESFSYVDLLTKHGLPDHIIEDMTLNRAGVIVWREGQGFILTSRGHIIAAHKTYTSQSVEGGNGRVNPVLQAFRAVDNRADGERYLDMFLAEFAGNLGGDHIVGALDGFECDWHDNPNGPGGMWFEPSEGAIARHHAASTHAWKVLTRLAALRVSARALS